MSSYDILYSVFLYDVVRACVYVRVRVYARACRTNTYSHIAAIMYKYLWFYLFVWMIFVDPSWKRCIQ